MGNIFWTGYSSGDRHHIITGARESIAGYGDIVDIQLFSDVSIVITIEIQERNIDGLYNDLKKHMLLDESGKLDSKSDNERVIYLNITFAQATGDLKVKVSSVPGVMH